MTDISSEKYTSVCCELISTNLSSKRKKELEKIKINYERKEKLKHLNNL